MIYCPNCNKPSAKTDGACPHCGGQLRPKSKGQKKQQKAAPRESAPRESVARKSEPQPATEQQFAGMDSGGEIDMGDMDEDSGLELEVLNSMIPPAHAQSPAQAYGGPDIQMESEAMEEEEDEDDTEGDAFGDIDVDKEEEPLPSEVAASPADNAPSLELKEKASATKENISDMEVSDLAGFGMPGSGLIDTVKYGLRVSKRLKELTIAKESASSAKEAAWLSLEVSKAELGRQAHAQGVTTDVMEKLVGKARTFDGELAGARRAEESLKAEHDKKVEVIDQSIEKVDEECAPIRQEELAAVAAYDKVVTDKKRILAKLKRSEIELRNCKEIIEKRQQEYADLERPKEERERLLKQIAEFDNKQPAIAAKLDDEKKELEALNEPMAKAQESLREVRSRLGEKNETMAGFRREKENLQKAFMDAQESAHQKVQGESAHAQEAWAQVGERVYVNELHKTKELSAYGESVNNRSKTFFVAQRNLDLHEQALVCYDARTYQKFKTVAKLGIGAIGIIIGLLVSLAIFSGK